MLTLLINFVLFFSAPFASVTEYNVKFLFAFPEAPILGLSISRPQAIAIDPEGSVYILDTGNNRIVKFNNKGEYVFTLGGFGWETEQFDRPLDITAKTGLEFFVADFNNERIERYDKKLNYISSFYSEETFSTNLQFGFPSSVDVSAHGELFICDNENNRILKLNTLGEPVVSFGDFNWGDGQLEHPAKVEVSPGNLIYVSDQSANQIVVFDYFGNFVSKFGKGVLNNPQGMTWSQNKLFVADSGNDRLVVFDKNHRLIYSWGDEGSKIGAFKNPVDVVVFDGRIYVLDSGNNRVQVFELIEN
ncbi:NHL repeat-containing protein [candidate division KSB1 bacterium]|nr:NHL repeat-containing protein [candidate division KSB1 bacterium]